MLVNLHIIFAADKLLWMRYVKSETPHKEVLPKPFAETLNSFQKAMLIKVVSNMKLTLAVNRKEKQKH